ncbi:MAG: hypothetical protein GX809_03825 [Clostridiaceae bacterium]|jgi:outer membrane lipoprotein SlyB|nr:hypothetical protein [Clostridiaceae bacterium]
MPNTPAFLPVLLAVDFERTFSLIIKVGLGLAAFSLAMKILMALVGGYFKMKLQSDINKHGLVDVAIREVDSQTYDDTLANTIMGHGLAGSLGAAFGAMSGRQREQVKSIRFWIKLGNGDKRDVTLRPRDSVCQQLLAFIDSREFKNW